MALKKNPKYDIKRNYKRAFELGMIFSLLFLIAAFKFFPSIEPVEQIRPYVPDVPNIMEPPVTNETPKPPPPPKPPIPIENPEVDELDNVNIESSELDEKAIISKTGPPLVEKEETEEYFKFLPAEDLPKPIGGVAGIMGKIVYPEIARRAGISGLVSIDAYVDENGDVQKVILLKGIGGGCDEAAMNAVLNTKFIPGRQRGRPVKVIINIPVRFNLK